MESDELKMFDKVRIYLDEDYSSAENFTVSINTSQYIFILFWLSKIIKRSVNNEIALSQKLILGIC